MEDLASELHKALSLPQTATMHLQAFFMDLLWMFEEDPKGVLKEKYTATEEELAHAINVELSDFLREAEILIDKAMSCDPKIMSIHLERPDTLRVEMILR